MKTRNSHHPDASPGEPKGLGQCLRNAAAYWEPRRLLYNIVLMAVVAAWLFLTWPHFRPALNFSSLLKMSLLALMANICFCAAYLVDIPVAYSTVAQQWQRWRPALWFAGTLFAILLANYWIGDEIYPFV
jgi:hypothetical protein